jgi:signal transduction histidine kinase
MPSRVNAAVEDSAPAGISAALWSALRRAAAGVHAHWGRAVEDGAPADEVREHLTLLCAAVGRAAVGEEPRLRAFRPSMPSRRLIESVRRRFLAEVQELPDADPSELLRLLGAMERVQELIDRDTSQRFASRLSGADGLELLVEVAHDLRSPLASVLFLAETLRNAQSGPITPIQERQLGLIYSAAFGLSSLASDVIELARGGDRLVDLHPVPFSVTDILQTVRDIVQPIAEEKGLTTRLHGPEADFRIGHPSALQRVLLNLTTNALKFTSEGYVEVTAKQLSRTLVEFSVRDTGRGIPPNVVPTLFEPFRRRVKPGEYTFSSAGLGLSICQKLVDAMGGKLQVETAVGSGTRFYFQLQLPLAARM